MTKIHPTAVIDKGAELASDVEVGPYCVVGAGVKIGAGTRLESHVVVMNDTTLGKNCRCFPFASFGTEPQDLKYQGEKTKIIIGDNNRFGQTATVELGTKGGGGVTRIGSNGLFMIGVHIGHDSQIGDGAVLANHVTLAGHVRLGDFVHIGGMTAVQQFSRIGAHAMVGGVSGVTRDVIPYGASFSNPAVLGGLNLVGLKRHKFSRDSIHAIRNAYKEVILGDSATLEARLAKACKKWQGQKEVMLMLDFIRTADKQRGLCLPAKP